MTNVAHRTLAVIVGLLTTAACSNSSSTDATPAPTSTTGATVGATPTTTSTPTNTATTTAEGPTTTHRLAEQFVLRSDGLGEWDFGISPAAMIDVLISEYGDAEQHDSEYPIENALDSGSYGTDADPTTLYEFPFGRTLCWDFGFCVYMGGDGPDSLASFTGWTYTDDRTLPVPTPRGWHLSAADGLTIGMSLLEDPVYLMHFLYREVECEEIGVGEVAGFTLELLSLYGPLPDFTVVGYSGETVDERGTVVITQIDSGDVPRYTGGDHCGL
ncbi:MAG: hypothetical protein ABL953_05385 [Ilumatobacteraceae bacterium]